MRRASVLIASLVILASTGAVVATGNSAALEKAPLPVRGMVKPFQQAAITTELQARVIEVRYREGETFSRGDILVAFDCERQQAEADAAAAQLRETSAAFESASYLDRKGASGRLEVAIAQARMEKSAADVAGFSAKMKLCKVLAPFDGRVAEQLINAHEVPAVGKPMISIVDESVFEIELIVPSSWLRHLTKGSQFQFSVDELAQVFDAKLVRVGAVVDPVSQTAKVFGAFSSKPDRVLSGMSGSAIFEGSIQ